MNPVDSEFYQWLATLGIGGILAGFMFMFYRKDMKQFTDMWKITSDQLIAVIKENPSSNTKLTTLIENSERNALRKEDIVSLIDRKLMERGK